MYTLSYHRASISVPEYLENYVDVPTFLKACKACPNYNKLWSCPPYDFDVLDYWNKYTTMNLLAVKVEFDEEALSKTYSQEEINDILHDIFVVQRSNLTEKLLEEEKDYPGSVSLSAGSCCRCPNGCTKTEGKPCRFPNEMRYSIESLGGNVGLTIEKLMGLSLEWIEEGKLPPHFVMVCGLLIP